MADPLLPDIDLRQVLTLTDDTGMAQHATFGVPDHHHGYCIDDNCRALIAGLLYNELRPEGGLELPLSRYLAFIAYAFNQERGRFRNFMGFDRRWLEEVGSDDSHGRTLWSLGMACRRAAADDVRGLAERLFIAGLPVVRDFPFIRSHAFAILGLAEYLAVNPDHGECRELLEESAAYLHETWRKESSPDWRWWEDLVTYDNGKLPHAMLVAGALLGDEAMQADALDALTWLIDQQTAAEGGHLSIIGNAGWLSRDGHRARFDQQPLDAHALVDACVTAADITGDPAWFERARWACAWFFGGNDLGLPLYDETTGGCHDGLRADGFNQNQGAESTLALVLSVLRLHAYRRTPTRTVPAHAARPVGLAVVGASSFAAFCLESWDGLPGVEARAVWSRTPESAQDLAGAFGLEAFPSLEALLADDRIGLVHVAAVPAVHAEHAEAALAAGKHVLVEKPLATSLADAHRLADTAARRDRRLAVNFMMRHGRAARAVQAILEAGLLGAPLRGTVVNLAGDDGLPADHWFWDRSTGGGIFVEHAVHFFDLFRSWLGEGQVVDARFLERPGTGQEDQALCEVRHGAQATVGHYHGFVRSHHLDTQRVAIHCERGSIELEGWVATRLRVEAVLDEGRAQALAALLPDGTRLGRRPLAEDERRGSRRLGREEVTLRVDDAWTYAGDGQEAYAEALRHLLADLLAGIGDPRHRLSTGLDAGISALDLAVAATALADGSPA